ncbi:MAG: cellulase family glycosylhydrolase [Burkholderiales bacterium]|nr:cellulase family glycosylhydrolase [Burkholderiales bacterium]
MRAHRSRWRAALACLGVTMTLGWSGGAALGVESGVSLSVRDPAASLLAPGAGERTLHFAAAPAPGAGTRLSVRLHDYLANGEPNPATLASTQAPLAGAGATSGVGEATVRLQLPGIGFYLLDARLLAPDGTVIARRRINLAAIPPRSVLGPPDFGVGATFDHGPYAPDVLLSIIRNAGFSWIRGEVPWTEVEKRPGVFRFPAQFGNALDLASRMGIKSLVLLDYGNAHAYPSLFKGDNAFPMTAAAREKFVQYAAAVVKRYGAQVDDWEIWNEPHFKEIGYHAYVALLKDVYPVIKRLAPSSGVVSCGGDWGGNPVDACIDAIIKQGALNDQDGFSIHPYMFPAAPEVGYAGVGVPVAPVNITTVWPYLGRLIARNPRSNGQPLQLWVSEIGWPSAPRSPGQNTVTQAAYLLRTYLLSRRYGVARGVFWYDLVDNGTNPDDKESNFGLLRADLSPKPAFAAAAVLAATLERRAWRAALVDTPQTKVFEYGTSEPVIAGWTVAGERVVHLRLPAGAYVQRDWDGRQQPVAETNGQIDWKLGPLPRYLLPAPTH